jgi:hypothetical protein
VQQGKEMDGAVLFATGKLGSVSKDLMPFGGDELEFGNQLYFAMRDLESEGNSRCIIETEAGEVPEFFGKDRQAAMGAEVHTDRVTKIPKTGRDRSTARRTRCPLK